MSKIVIKAHIISHTHWDREWFLSSQYTNEWLVPFFDKLFSLLSVHGDYTFVLDGQMQMIDDYLNQLEGDERDEKKKLLKKFGKEERLLFGPYWSQIDWRIAGTESGVRNILIGHKMSNVYGNTMKNGWLLDNFGQIGQIPQIHKLSGINGLFVWRGVEFPDDDVRSEFLWKSPDGSQLMSSYFLDSYRNLMGITLYPEIALQRVKNEIEKVRNFLTSSNALLMNGYDLDDQPEDPFEVLSMNESDGVKLLRSTPQSYLRAVRKNAPSLKVLSGEQLSGRYVSVFPGTLSTRVYLKLMNYRCEYMLTRMVEPIGTMCWMLNGYYPHDEIEDMWRSLLSNESHDNICGVGVDQIHSQMEERYKSIWSKSRKILDDLLAKILEIFPKNSTVVFNTNPFPITVPVETTDGVLYVEDVPALGYRSGNFKSFDKVTNGSERVQKFVWENPFYTASINANGTLNLYDKSSGKSYKGVGYFQDEGDAGDEYNYSPPINDEIFTSKGCTANVRVLYETAVAAKVRIEVKMKISSRLDGEKRALEKTVLKISYDVTFDTTPVIKYKVHVENTARDHRLKMVFPAGKVERVIAEMPFEYAERKEFVDNSKPVPFKLRRLLIGARECEKERTFPMKDFVAVEEKGNVLSVMTKGLCEYEMRNNALFVTLVRSVEWIAKSGLKTRIGDAGPAMYTPDAQCLRNLDYEMGIYIGDLPSLTKWVQVFHNPPLIVKNVEGNGKNDKMVSLFNFENVELKLTALKVAEKEDGIVLRFFNPHSYHVSLRIPNELKIFKVDLLEEVIEEVEGALKVRPHEIVTLKIGFKAGKKDAPSRVSFEFLSKLTFPCFEKISNAFEDEKLKTLRQRVKDLEIRIENLKKEIEGSEELKFHEKAFELLCMQRTYLESVLSILLNEEKNTQEPEKRKRLKKKIGEVGFQLNKARIKRRAYEYVLDYWRNALR